MLSPLKVGERLPTFTRHVVFEKMVEFEKVVWDRGRNSHSDPEAAKRDGISKPIASGQNQMAFLHELLEENFGDGWVYGGKISVRYIHPVYAGDQITPHAVVKDVSEAAGGLRVSLDIWCENQDGRKTAAGNGFSRRPIVNAQLDDSRRGRDQMTSAGPLAGVRVVELTHAWAGPYCGMMLGDMGAEVIKIENPRQKTEARGGYPYVGNESVLFMMLHRNKKSVTLDLKQPAGKRIFLDLVRSADVLIQNFRPGLMEKLGIDYEKLKTINPALVYATLSGFGKTGPKAELPGVNMIALALSGLASTTIVDDQPPVPFGYALCDVVASMWASHGILSAYISRLKTGKGQEVDTSLVEAGISLMVSPVAQHYHVKGDWLAQTGRNDSNAPSGFFMTSDGTYLTVFASYPALWDRFVVAMRLQHLASDPRFRERNQRTKHAAELHNMLAEIFRTKPTDHWVHLLTTAGVPASPVNTVGGMIEDEQVVARNMIVEQQHPTAGKIRVVGVPVKLSETPGGVRTPAPLLGEHTAEILGALGYADELDVLKRDAVI